MGALFRQKNLDDELAKKEAGASFLVDKIKKEQFLISTDEEVMEFVKDHLFIERINLRENEKTMTQSETKVDVSQDRRRFFLGDHSGRYFLPGTRVDVDVPFDGESWIFECKTNPFPSIPPEGLIIGNVLRISVALPQDEAIEEFKLAVDRMLMMIKNSVNLANSQVDAFNGRIKNTIRRAIKDRRNRLKQQAGIAQLLDIPLAVRTGAPSIVPVKLEIRRPPLLPVPPKTGLAPEPGISDSTFEHILHFIRHQGRTFERMPSTFAVHGEEELRNFILAQLKGHFEGAASGESFRRNGKTDILIEEGNRAAFVGECKVWTGPAGLSAAIDQLLGYLTWRDGKSALLMFNTKNKDFSKILESMPCTIRAHPLFVKDLQNPGGGEWRVEMRSKEDVGRRVAVHCFVFDIFPK